MPRKKNVQYENVNGGVYEQEYEETELYCSSCGKQSIWVDNGWGDYYEGNEHVCADCGTSFYTNGFSRNTEASDQLNEA